MDKDNTTFLKGRFDDILKLVKMPTETASKDNSQSIYQWTVPKHILSFLLSSGAWLNALKIS